MYLGSEDMVGLYRPTFYGDIQ
jgi:hypothetical protein